ncbi:MAG: sugar phosphate nucleotidyltransferase [Sorangiineae bacterium]|nr:sugar phosphate nucleotidyltransferase [Polyangiaceae bacterium]MEB2324719.1 sugar phosphate nucleotidyltransferase [Sorangiineae bacterium]
MTRAMVLAAGLGTRLQPLTGELPKPLVPIGDAPLLAHLARALAGAGLPELTLNVHHLPDKFASIIERLDARVTVIHEPVIRGTAGGVAGARACLGPAPVVVWNGDILIDAPPLAALLAFSGDGLCLTVAPRAAGAGTVGLDRAGRVVRLRGERFGEEAASGDYVGLCALGARALAGLPEQGCLIGDWALPELRAGRAVESVRLEGGWRDVGSLASYLAANQAWLDAGPRGVQGGSYQGRGASVGAGVRLARSLVGDGAVVEGAGALERCVVWPGARAVAPLRDAVVTTAGLVVRCDRAPEGHRDDPGASPSDS